MLGDLFRETLHLDDLEYLDDLDDLGATSTIRGYVPMVSQTPHC